MSITLQGSPEQMQPGYNPVWWYWDSNNKNRDGFRYVVDLYIKTGPSSETLLGRFRRWPRYGDGLCAFDASTVLSSLMTNQLPSDGHATDPLNSYVRYNIKVGEEFRDPWEYSDYEFYSNPSSIYNAYTQLRNFDSPPFAHNFQVGDQINVVQDGTSPPFDAVSGLHTVVEVPDAYTIVIDIPFPGSGPTTPGTAAFADGRTTIYPDLLAHDDYRVFNGALPVQALRTWDDASIAMSISSPGAAMTDQPSSFTVRPTSSVSFNFYNNLADTAYYLYGQNDSGAVWRRQVASTSSVCNWNPVGPGNIQLNSQVSGSGALVTSATAWYDVWMANTSGTRCSDVYRFVIDRRCATYREHEVCFLDRMGSLSSFSFYYRSGRTVSVERQSNAFDLGNLSGGRWTYATTDSGRRTTGLSATELLTLRTAWLTDEESEYFKQLVTSPFTLVRDLSGDGLFYPYVCRTQTLSVERRENTKAIRYTLEFEPANRDAVNI